VRRPDIAARCPSLLHPLTHAIVHDIADVIPSRADGEGPHASCLITQLHLRAPQRDCEVLRFAQDDSASLFRAAPLIHPIIHGLVPQT
jgi:hypothetical protein